jgi:hypothetical protein
VLVERRGRYLPTNPPHWAEAQADIASQKALLVRQQLPRRPQQRSFARTRIAVRRTHLEPQRRAHLLQQRVQLPAVAVEPTIKLTPKRQKTSRSVRRVEKLTVATRKPLQRRNRSRIQMPPTANRRIAAHQLKRAVKNQNTNHEEMTGLIEARSLSLKLHRKASLIEDHRRRMPNPRSYGHEVRARRYLAPCIMGQLGLACRSSDFGHLVLAETLTGLFPVRATPCQADPWPFSLPTRCQRVD